MVYLLRGHLRAMPDGPQQFELPAQARGIC